MSGKRYSDEFKAEAAKQVIDRVHPRFHGHLREGRSRP